jgi:glycosyltransferase involved in cell wall biosynthesis
MRVLFLSVSAGLGGSERVLVDAVAGLHAAHERWSLRVLLMEAGPLQAVLEAVGAETGVIPLPTRVSRLGEFGSSPAALGVRALAAAPSLAAYAARLRRAVTAWRPDVIHCNGLKADALAAVLHLPSARLVWHLHDFVNSRPVSSVLLRMCAPRADVILANSRAVAADVDATLGEPGRARAVLNPVNTERFSPAGDAVDLDARAGFPPAAHGIVRVGLVGTYARWKGHEVFLRAVAGLDCRVPLRAYIVGGPLYGTPGSQYTDGELTALRDTLGLRQRVGFVPFQADVAPVYRSLDVVVHASVRPEPFGLVIAEAMACGRAVIAASAGGALEIGTSETAVFSPPGDVDGLAAAIRRLALDAGERRALGAAARQRAVDLFGRARFARELAAAYRS